MHAFEKKEWNYLTANAARKETRLLNGKRILALAETGRSSREDLSQDGIAEGTVLEGSTI